MSKCRFCKKILPFWHFYLFYCSRVYYIFDNNKTFHLMPSAATALQRFEPLQQEYLRALDHYSFEQLLKKPDAHSWSLGQMYQHLINSARFFHLKQVEKCLNSTENTSGKLSFRGFLALHLLHAFPPIRVQVPPSEAYTPKQPESVEALRAGLEQTLHDMRAMLPRLASDHGGKTAHPAFGMMRAQQWYQLVEMHYRHHLRQKKRLDAFISSQKP
jgi:hypothetical protein